MYTRITSETGQRRDYYVGGKYSYSGIGILVHWLTGVRYYVVCVFRSPVAGLSLRRFAFLFLSLSRSRRPLALSLARPPFPSGARALCSPGCSLALSHPQCAHRTRPGRKSFPLRVARTTRTFRIASTPRPRTDLWIAHRSFDRSLSS